MKHMNIMGRLMGLLLLLPTMALGALDNFANFSYATLSAGIDAVTTSITVTDASRLPAASFNAIVWNATDYSPDTDPDTEVVRVTNIAGNTLTVTRAQEGTGAVAHNTAGKVYLILATITAKTLNDDIPTLITNAIAAAAELPSGDDGKWLTLSGALPAWSYPTNLPSLNITNNLTVGGQGLFADGSATAPSIGWTSDNDGSGTGFYRNQANSINWTANGVNSGQISGDGIRVFDGDTFAIGSSSATTVWLHRDAANTLAQRNGTNAQTNRIYGTYTDASNYERGSFSHDGAGTLTIAAEEAGTGTDNQTIKVLTKGTGAFIVDNPSTTAGNARGTGAVDLQLYRTAATQVAKGNTSIVAGGYRNTASGDSSAVTGGNINTASGAYSTATGGSDNVVAGAWSRTGGSGGYSPLQGQDSFGANLFSGVVGVQNSIVLAGRVSSGATVTNLTTTGGALAAGSAIAVPNNHTWTFTGTVTGHSLTAGTPRETAAYEVKGQITRGANAAATTLVWSAVTVNYEADAAWDVALAADTTNGALDVKVNGNDETAVRWLLNLEFGQVGGTE